MNSYLPELDNDGNVKPTFNIDDFDRANASVTYADLSDYAFLYGSNNFFGSNSFLDIFVSSINSIAETTLSYIKNLRSDAQTQIDSKTSLSEIQANNNTFTGSTAFNTYLPTSTITPTNSIDLTTKAYVDTKATISQIIGNNNTWTGTNTFNTSLPTTTLTPTLNTHLCRKVYVDGQVATKASLTDVQSNNNNWTGTNTYNTSLPTSTLTPTTSTQLVTKAYVDAKPTLAEIQANNNTWTGSNSYTQGISTGGYTSFYNGNFVVNAGSIYAYKQINMYGVAQLFYDLASGGTMSAIYRDNATKNLMIDSYYYNNSIGGGVVFRLKNPIGTDNYSDVLSVQPLSITANQPVTINSNLSVTGNINGKTPTQISYLDATSSIQTQFNNIGNILSGISYTSATDITTIDNHVLLPTGNNLFLGSTYNVKTNIDDCITKLSGISYNAISDTTMIDNNVVINKSLGVVNNLAVTNCFETFENAISSTDFTEQLTQGQSLDQDLATITLTGPFSKEININLSISGSLFWRNSTTNSSAKLQYNSKLNSLTVYIYKNGALWQSNVPQYNPEGLFNSNTFRLPYSIKTESLQYFMNNSLIKFLPDIRRNLQTPDTYSIRVSFSFTTDVKNYTIATNTVSTYTAGFLTFIPYISTNVSYSYNNSDSSLINYSSSSFDIVSYTHGTYAPTSTTVVRENVYRFGLDVNTLKEFQCANSYTNNARINTLTATDSVLTNATVTTATITNATITNANISNISSGYTFKSRSNVAGYMFNGASNFEVTPIVCSMKGISPDNADDYYIVNPGFYFILYRDLWYISSSDEIENNGNEPIVFTPSTKNTTSSIRVYFRSNPNETWTSAHEITFAGISS